MSSRSRIVAIYRKELIDILRDHRTMLAMVIVPVVIYPVLMLGFIRMAESEGARLRTQTFHVRVADEPTRELLRGIIDDVQAATKEEQRPQPKFSITAGSADEEVLSDEVQLVVGLDLRDNPVPAIELHPMYRLKVGIVYNEVDVRSRTAKEELAAIFERNNASTREQALLQILGTPETQDAARQRIEFILNPIAIESKSIATERQLGGWALGQVVPLVLVLMTITGAIYPAIDLTAGERERGTLETLMVAPVPVFTLIVGKFLVVASIALLAAILNVLCVGVTMHLGGLTSVMASQMSVEIPYETFPIIIFCMIPFALLFAAILVAVCSFARSSKEAQNYVMPVIIGAMVPAVSVLLPTVRLEGITLVLPVGNMVLLTRELFQQTYTWSQVFIVVLSTTLYASAAVAVAAKLFGQEAVLFADAGSYKTLIRRESFLPSVRPSAAQALLLVALLFPASFYAQSFLGQLGGGDFLWTQSVLVAVQFGGLFLVLPLVVAWYLKNQVKTTFLLALPSVFAWIGALLIGVSSWAMAREMIAWQSYVMPISPILHDASKAIEAQLVAAPLGLVLLMMAVVPAVTEEWLFRGYLLSGLASTFRKWAAIAVSGFLFGVFHFHVDRIPLTFALGMLMAYLCWQSRSLGPAILAHALHNGISVTMLCRPEWFTWMRFPDVPEEAVAPHLPVHVLIPTAACFVLGIVIFTLLPSRPARETSEAMIVREEPA